MQIYGMFVKFKNMINIWKSQIGLLKSADGEPFVRKEISMFDSHFISQDVLSLLHTLDHPHIVKIYNVERNAFGAIIDQEFCKFKSINEVLQQVRINLDNLNSLIIECLKGIIYLNETNLVHGDLKISNILLQYDGKTYFHKIGDLESCQRPGKCRTLFTRSTPEIAAPEILRYRRYYYSSDVWSLGVMVFLLLTGEYPFGNRRKDRLTDIKYRRERCIVDKDLEDSLSDPYRTFIKMCLTLDPEKRIRPDGLLDFCLKNF